MKNKKSSERKLTDVAIPTSLYRRIEQLAKETGFTSVSSYIVYVLRNSLGEKEEKEEAFSKNDEEKIKARLRALGYID